ncbi:H/ACA ribonucleoprotein complex non-core subunit NAF1-like [Actinia tenebrosa]|uniref:H/ACA ribonucleoprotein complex non-core subunit NAF1 n=1 Tax=Actinia tenebrosa TaxID=6105 RepID=A0A6P8GX57_ACTTE|nr:H/ACA ribonucleoprotein complex non-core subunit NAF1-like [Actinia tenebrosa]
MSSLYNVDCQREENSSPDQRNNSKEEALSSTNGQETVISNEELADCATLKEDVDKDILPEKAPLPDVEQTVVELVSKVDAIVAYEKEKLKSKDIGILESSLKNSDTEKSNENEMVGTTERSDTGVLSDVLGIVEEILVKVNENVDKQCEQSSISMECIDGNQNKHGEKRSYSEVIEDDVMTDVPILDAAKDSLYIMSLVEAELEAVGQGIEVNNNRKDKPRLVDYDDDDDDDDSNESSDDESSDTESSDSDSTSSEDSFTIQKNRIEKMENEEDKISIDPPKTKDELLFKDLPPEPEVNLMLSNDVNLVHIGSVMSVVESMVVVKSLPDTPALDVDTLLFLENRKCLGKVFETFGPVRNPFYSVRFNTPEDITKMDVKQGMMVFFVPEDLDFTKLVFISQLQRLKGSDASWKYDQEPPQELIEYSDDEEEAKAKAAKKQERRSNKPQFKGQTDTKNIDSRENTFPSPKKPPQHKESTRNWQGRGRGKPYPNNDQQHQPPPRLPHPPHRGPPPSFGGLPPHFMPHPPPFFPGSFTHGMRPPPSYLHAPFSCPPPLPLPPDMYQVPPPQWNPGRPSYEAPPPAFPPFQNQPPTSK